MNTAVIVVTHGASGIALCESVQMIVGEQTQLFSTDFLPGENVDSLKKKLNTIVEQISSDSNILFLVDLFGGSPFNASCLLAANRENCDVITGVSIPMLITVLIERESISSFDELTACAKTFAVDGIKQFKTDVAVNYENDEEDL